MAKTKVERIAGIEAEIKQLENRRKRLLQQQKEQERKVRTRRLIERGAILKWPFLGFFLRALTVARNIYRVYTE